MSRAKESVQRFLKSLDKGKKVELARKTQFIPQLDGSLRRLVTRKDGTVEKDELIPAYPSLLRIAAKQTAKLRKLST